MDFSLRAATVDDCADLHRMMKELAEYENVTHLLRLELKDLEEDGFGKNPFFRSIIAEVPGEEGQLKVGYALYFFSYSSWKGRSVYLEDLYVMPQFRGRGLGLALMSEVAQVGLDSGCSQMNFTVLDWNKSSLDFYHRQGCTDLTQDLGYHWMCCGGENLKNLAQASKTTTTKNLAQSNQISATQDLAQSNHTS